MFDFKKLPVQISGLLLTLTTVSALPTVSASIGPAFAQSSNNTNNLPLPESVLPKSLPKGKTLKVYGSSSMAVPNQALKKRLLQKYPGTQVQLVTTTTDKAMQALLSGKIDLAAIGRPLTNQEKAKKLVFVPVKRDKIAIIVAAANPFKKDLTFEQFAKMFHGQITNWSQVGGPPGKIRFIDRPGYSDTRQALSTYAVFKKAPFKTGANATQLPQDDTAAVIQKLGKDGISYAIVDQAVNLKNVRIVRMHNTLPTDPRYPYSQPRGYAYKPGMFAAPPPVVEPKPPVQPTATPKPTPEPEPIVYDERLPWWLLLLLLLGIPILGGLIWWFFKGSQDLPVPPSDPIVPIPPSDPIVPIPPSDPIVPIPPIIPIKPQSGQLMVDATWGNDDNEMNNLPTYTNPSDKTIVVKIEAEGTWSYGAPDPTHKFDLQVDGDGNQHMAEKELQDNDLRFQDKLPAALIALKNGAVVASGKGPYEVTLKGHESLSFVINDEPGFYKDNNDKLIVKWSIVKTQG